MAMNLEERGVMRSLVTLLEGERDVVVRAFSEAGSKRLSSDTPSDIRLLVRRMNRAIREGRRLLGGKEQKEQ